MNPDRKALISLLASFITEYPKGSIIPEQIMHFFLDQYTSHALRGKWLATDMLVQWLSGEYDFSTDDVTRLIEENRDLIREKAGVEILLPGEEYPPETVEKHKTEVEQWKDDWEDGYECVEEEEEIEVEVEEYEEDEKLELADYTESAPPSMVVEEERDRSDRSEDDFIEMADHSEMPEQPAAGAREVTPPHSLLTPDVSELSAQPAKINHATIARIKPKKSVVRKKVRKKVKCPVSAAPPTLKPNEAMQILASMVSHKPNVEEVIAQLVTNKVLTGNFEREICKADAPQTGVNLTIKEALCWLLILEVDHAQYSSLRRIGGVILKHAVRQTKELLETARGQLGTLNNAAMEAAKSGEIANLSAIKGIAARLEGAISQQKELVTAMSYLEAPPARIETPARKPTPSPAEKKEKAGKTKAKKQSREGDSPVKTAIAAVIMVAVLTVSGLYIKSVVSGPTQEVFQVSDYSNIIQLKEARQSSTTFLGVVDTAYWNSMGKSERKRRAHKLFEAVKSDKITTLTLVNEQRQPVVQTYAGQLRVF